MSQQEFEKNVTTITADIAGRTIDDSLQNYLNEKFPPESDGFLQLAAACRKRIEEGWLSNLDFFRLISEH